LSAKAVKGFLSGGPDVPHVRTGGTEGAGSAAMGKELPQVAHPSACPKAGHSRTARHVSGDEADAGNGHAAAWDAQRHSGHVAAREHQDHGGRLRSDDRAERSCGGELAHISSARRLEDAGEEFGSEGEKPERSEWNSAKFGEVD